MPARSCLPLELQPAKLPIRKTGENADK